MTSDAYRAAQSDYYSAKILGKGNIADAVEALRILTRDPSELPSITVRYEELKGLGQMLGSDFKNRDFTGSVELDALRLAFETG